MDIVNHDFPHQGRDSAFGSLKLFEADGLEYQEGQMSSLILGFKYQGAKTLAGSLRLAIFKRGLLLPLQSEMSLNGQV